MSKKSVEIHLLQSSEPLDWTKIFGREGSVEIEVGCGKGKFLLNRAAQNPDRDFLALEFANAYFRAIAERAAARELTNLRVVKAEASDFIRRYVGDQSLSGFHLLYPDPWPKKRHHKRRLIQEAFLKELRRTLKRDAIINIATDHRGYFDWMCAHFDRWKATFVVEAAVVSTRKELDRMEGRTNYEIKFIQDGRPLHFITGYRTGF